MKREILTEEAFADWLEHPVTEVVRRVLATKRRERAREWENGTVLELAKDTQMLLNAAAIGECQGLKFVQELTLEQLRGEMEDDSE